MPQFIFLIGMPAAGKTYWGRQLAEAMDIQFIDLDSFIVAREQKTIPGLFEDSGEQYFRDLETRYLKQLIGSAAGNTIVACGGGTPCFNNNMHRMNEAGTTIYLQLTIPQLLSNLSKDAEPRPLLNGKTDLSGFLLQLLDQRKTYYEQAHHILPSDNISLPTFVEIVSSCINKP